MGVAERRHRERQERRCQILDAAQEVFAARGLAAATMDEVAQKAEFSKGALYLYFASKDELYLGVVLRTVATVGGRIEAAANAGGTGLERTERFLRTYLEFATENPDAFRTGMSWLTTGYLLDAKASTFRVYSEAVGGLFARMVEALALGREDGSVRADLQPESAALNIWGGMVGNLLMSLNSTEVAKRLPQVSASAATAGYVDLIVSALRNPR